MIFRGVIYGVKIFLGGFECFEGILGATCKEKKKFGGKKNQGVDHCSVHLRSILFEVFNAAVSCLTISGGSLFS